MMEENDDLMSDSEEPLSSEAEKEIRCYEKWETTQIGGKNHEMFENFILIFI
jgi:hypothetical protein